jgi:hypothetical protein
MARQKGQVGAQYDPRLRVQALTMFDHGIHPNQIFGINASSIYAIHWRAIARGWNPNQGSPIILKYIENTRRLGRPKKATLEVICRHCYQRY